MSKPEDSVASFLSVFSGPEFAVVDFTHYLNRRGFMCSDRDAETILRQRKDMVVETASTGVYARVQ